MTVQETMCLNVRRAYALFIPGAIVFFGWLVLIPFGQISPARFLAFTIPGGFLVAISGYFLSRGVPCPGCGVKLMSCEYASLLGPGMKFCGHCGRSLEDEAPAECKSGKFPAKKTTWNDELA